MSSVVVVVIVIILVIVILLSLWNPLLQIDRFFSIDNCDSIVAAQFISTPEGSFIVLADVQDRNARLANVPTTYTRPQSFSPKSYTDWDLSARPAGINMTEVPGGDFIAMLYGPTGSPPSNITEYVAYYDYVIWTLYTSALGLKLSTPDLKVTCYLTGTGQVSPEDVDAGFAFGGSGWNTITMAMPTSLDISLHMKDRQQTIGHELFHVFSTFSDQTDMWTHGLAESLANFFGWLSVSMYNGQKGADILSHWLFVECYKRCNMPIDITFMVGGFGYDLGGLWQASYWMYGAWHIWYFWYKEYGIDSLVSFMNRPNKTKPIIFGKYFGNGPSGSPAFVPSENAGQTCPSGDTNIDLGMGDPTCKSGFLRDVDAQVVDLHVFLSTFVARTLTNAYFTDDFFAVYQKTTSTSGSLYWMGFVAMDFRGKTATPKLTPYPEDWRIVVAENNGTKWSTTIYKGTTSIVTTTLTTASNTSRIAFVAAFDHPMLPGNTPLWSVTFS